jgi:hypothetical protein
VLLLLTEYLVQARNVTIPHIGSLSLEHRPASWHPVDQVLQGPSYHIALAETGSPSLNQLEFLAASIGADEPQASEQLDQFGRKLKDQVQQSDFSWPGVGKFYWQDGAVALQAIALEPEPLRAERVIREDARHTVRVGEQEVDSSFHEERVVVDDTRQEALWLAWVCIALAVLFISFVLYSGGFSPQANGLHGPLGNLLP